MRAFSTQTLHGPLLEDLPTDGVWLLITSTHGAGDLPDNLQPLYDELLEQQPDLSNVRFGAVGIGSREYDTFCGAIEKVEAAVTACGAKQLGETLKINISIMTFLKIQPRSGSRNGKIYSKTIKDRAIRCG